MVDKLYHRAIPRSSFIPTVCFVVKIQRFVSPTPPINNGEIMLRVTMPKKLKG